MRSLPPSLRFRPQTLADDDATQRAFGKLVNTSVDPAAADHARARELCVMPSVSPAHATVKYADKRAGWMEHCFVGDVSEETWRRHREDSDDAAS